MDKVYIVDLVVIIVSVFVLIGAVGYVQPLVIAPIDEYESSDSDILFEISKADYLLIDDNIDFTTPDRYSVEEGMEIKLEPGKYYWKAVGILGSEVRTLTINSVVNLELRKVDGNYGVVNTGSSRLNVDVYNGTRLIEKKKLEVGDFTDGGDKYVGGQG
jgi:hypothetical protein